MKNEIIEEIYDSYLTREDTEIFLCRSNLLARKWVSRDTISNEQYEILRKINTEGQCNTNKESVYSCLVKVKTRGILLAATNCGIVLGYREIYRGEGLRQVGSFYLDICENYRSNQYIK